MRNILHCIIICTLLSGSAFAYDINDLISDAKSHYDKMQSEVQDFTIKQQTALKDPRANGMTISTTMYRKGDKWRVEGTMGDGQHNMETVTLFDGTDVWTSMMGMKNKLPQDEAFQHEAAANFLQAPPEGSELIGEETVNGRDCWIVKWPEKDSGEPVTTWIDKNDFVHVQSKSKVDGKEMTIVQSDFRTVKDDFILPYKTEVFSADTPMMTSTITGVTYNDGLSDELFDADKLGGGSGMQGLDMQQLMNQAKEMQKKYGDGKGN